MAAGKRRKNGGGKETSATLDSSAGKGEKAGFFKRRYFCFITGHRADRGIPKHEKAGMQRKKGTKTHDERRKTTSTCKASIQWLVKGKADTLFSVAAVMAFFASPLDRKRLAVTHGATSFGLQGKPDRKTMWKDKRGIWMINGTGDGGKG